ncbi:MAG: DMT family transporter [Bacteroidetes bacterium]|nr:DMT family transporter [Bacteroidota bacterium]
MRDYILYAVLSGLAWGIGGYFEKTGLKALGIPPIAGISLRTAVALVVLGLLSIPAWKGIEHPQDVTAWIMIVIAGGIVAGSLGMWSFYKSIARTDNLGVTLAIAFSVSPLAGTAVGLLKGNQPMDLKTAAGMLLIVAGIVVLQLSHRPAR